MTTILTGRATILRAQFSDGTMHRLGLGSLVDTMDGLLFMCEAGSPDVGLPSGISSVRGGQEEWQTRFDVFAISYNSPLEVVLGISAAMSGVSFAANRILSVFNRYQRSRVEMARADLAVYARNLIVDRFDLDEETLEVADPQRRRLDNAVVAIQTMESLRVEGGK